MKMRLSLVYIWPSVMIIILIYIHIYFLREYFYKRVNHPDFWMDINFKVASPTCSRHMMQTKIMMLKIKLIEVHAHP